MRLMIRRAEVRVLAGPVNGPVNTGRVARAFGLTSEACHAVSRSGRRRAPDVVVRRDRDARLGSSCGGVREHLPRRVALAGRARDRDAFIYSPSGAFVLGLGGLGGHGIGGTAGVIVIVVLMGLRMYMRSRGGGRGPRGRGPWR